MASKLTLPDSLHSRDQLAVCAEELHAVASTLAHQLRKQEAATLPPVSDFTEELINQLDAIKLDAAMAEELRDQVISAASWPLVSLVLAANPPKQLRMELVGWLRQAAGSGVLVEFSANPSIGGGLVIRTTNRVIDCSFSTQLLAKSATFKQALERV